MQRRGRHTRNTVEPQELGRIDDIVGCVEIEMGLAHITLMLRPCPISISYRIYVDARGRVVTRAWGPSPRQDDLYD